MQKNKGSCLCGAVNIYISDELTSLGVCHCNTCLRWGGGPFMAVGAGNDIEIEGEEFIAVYDSSDWAQRAFCQQCGSHLYYQLKPAQEYFLLAGLFEDKEKFKIERQIFIDKKPDYYSLSNQCQMLTEAEVIALYSPPEE